MLTIRPQHFQLLLITYFGVFAVVHAQSAAPEGGANNEVVDLIVGNELTVKGKAKIDSILENRLVNFDDQMMVNLVEMYPETAVAEYLIEVADDSNRHAVTRQRAMAWLAYTKDDRAEDFLRSYVERLTNLEKKDLDFVEFNLLHAAIMSQGSIGSNSSIDYLLQISSKDFWERKTISCNWLNMDAEGIETHMRKAALWGIVRSETSRAVALFPSDSNPMPGLLSEEEAASLARTARLRAQKVYVDPEAQREASQQSEPSNIQGE
ncbi:MAG: hypothetical protein AMXMBFR82_07120 [Candidatus Hydrogenedentota bacterium]